MNIKVYLAKQLGSWVFWHSLMKKKEKKKKHEFGRLLLYINNKYKLLEFVVRKNKTKLIDVTYDLVQNREARAHSFDYKD